MHSTDTWHIGFGCIFTLPSLESKELLCVLTSLLFPTTSDTRVKAPCCIFLHLHNINRDACLWNKCQVVSLQITTNLSFSIIWKDGRWEKAKAAAIILYYTNISVTWNYCQALWNTLVILQLYDSMATKRLINSKNEKKIHFLTL